MFIFYDLESTGLNPFHDQITEICCIKEIPREFPAQKFTTLVNPLRPIPEIVTKITGINEFMVANQPNFHQISEKLIYFLNSNLGESSAYLIAHNNNGYDKLMLTTHFKNIGVDIKHFTWKFLDTLLIAKKLYPQLKKYNLKSLCQHFDLELLDAHRAEADTIMVQNLFYRMLEDLQKVLGVSLVELIKKPQIIYDYIS